jgi:nicotinate-nucleotide adenylyltransferase
MEKIAIFGGTFNPIHNGHIHLCEECDAVFQFDRILLMPTNIPPHKTAEDLASNEDRLMMCRLACEDYPKISVCDLEMRMQGISYTVHTVKELKKRYPTAKLYWIIGSDMLFSFHKWYCYREILEYVTLIAGARYPEEYERMAEYAEKVLKAGQKVRIIRSEVLTVSSTQIRSALEMGKQAEHLAPKVEAYIAEHGLYTQPEKRSE